MLSGILKAKIEANPPRGKTLVCMSIIDNILNILSKDINITWSLTKKKRI